MALTEMGNGAGLEDGKEAVSSSRSFLRTWDEESSMDFFFLLLFLSDELISRRPDEASACCGEQTRIHISATQNATADFLLYRKFILFHESLAMFMCRFCFSGMCTSAMQALLLAKYLLLPLRRQATGKTRS